MKSHWHVRRDLALVAAIAGVLLASGGASAQQLQGKSLVNALQRGGYVILMRHANAPRELPSAQTADPENVHLERQLDENGRTTAVAFGKALRDLKIPVGQVLSSPTYRAFETARYAQLPSPRAIPELGDNGQSMQLTKESQAAWLQKQVTEFLFRLQHHHHHPPTEHRGRFSAMVGGFVRRRSPHSWSRRQRGSQTHRPREN
jgi:broad specificity phosphatase PhoE